VNRLAWKRDPLGDTFPKARKGSPGASPAGGSLAQR
jgi:hypothetical protein